MTAHGLARNLLIASLLAACAGGPGLARDIEIEAGRPTRVTLSQVKEARAFLLQNASSTETAEFYADWQQHPLGKVVSDAQLQALLDVFSEKGLFARSLGAVPPGARDVLRVDQGGRSWIWARREAGVQASEAAFHEARSYFLEVYNSSTAYRPSAARPDLWAEKERANDDAEAAKNRLEQLKRQKP
jgi:hypothetical protein